jgi:hypothetical protein
MDRRLLGRYELIPGDTRIDDLGIGDVWPEWRGIERSNRFRQSMSGSDDTAERVRELFHQSTGLRSRAG